MGRNGRFTSSLRIGVWLVTLVALFAGTARSTPVGLAMQETGADSAIRIVHGISNAGPLDVYIDGAIALIGIVLGESSGRLALEAGEHAFAVVPTGASPDSAIADGQIALEEGTESYAALLGSTEEASVGLYAIDDRPIAAGAARFRVINGVVDGGDLVPAFTGGDALSEPLAFGDASQYAAIDAGVYDLDILDAETGSSLLSLPQTPFAEGAATDIFLYGLVSDGTMQALVIPTTLQTASVEGQVAQVLSGECAALGPVVAELGVVQAGQGAAVGVSGTAPVAQGFGQASLPFADLTETPHAVAVFASADEDEAAIACGEIGGQLTDTGALVIALTGSSAGGSDGVAFLAPALENPEATGISIFLLEPSRDDASGSSEPLSNEDTG
jgi:hypothetical protein